MDTFLDAALRLQYMDRDVTGTSMKIHAAFLTNTFQDSGITSCLSYERQSGDELLNTRLLIVRKDDPICLLGYPNSRSTTEDTYFGAENLKENPAIFVLRVPPGLKYKSVDESCFVEKPGGYDSEYDWKCVRSSGVFPSGSNVDEEGEGDDDIGVEDHKAKSSSTVFSLYCPSWPECPSALQSRSKSTGWPTDDLLHKVQKKGCHVVPNTFFPSQYEDIEWMCVFSLAEKELLDDLSFDMIACMKLLKRVEASTWSSTVDLQHKSAFNAYIIETACLWMQETISLPNNIIDICREILKWLDKKYQEVYVPHYFVPDHNLIHHISIETQEAVRRWIGNFLSNLTTIILCFGEMIGVVNEALLSIAQQLEDTSQSDGSGQVVTLGNLANNETATLLLTVAAEEFLPGGDVWASQEREVFVSSTFLGYYDIYYAIENAIEAYIPTEKLINLPETIVLPVIEALPSICKKENMSMFQCALYRLLGNLYLTITSALFDEDVQILKDKFTRKAMQYLDAGSEMVYSNGFNDEGLGVHFEKAMFYYLTRDWTKLESVITKQLGPKLAHFSKDSILLASVSTIIIHANSHLVVKSWSSDTEFTDQILKTAALKVVTHPIILSYYVMARYYCTQRQVSLAQGVLEEMEGCVLRIDLEEIVESSQAMVAIVKGCIQSISVTCDNHVTSSLPHTCKYAAL